MSRDPRRNQDQHRGLAAYLADDDVSAEKRGWVMLALVGHAFLYLLLTATEAIWVVAMAVRMWRRRDVGLVEAARTGVHKPTLSALLAANLGFAVVRRVGLAKAERLSGENTVQPGDSG
jgi:hypothetical protein